MFSSYRYSEFGKIKYIQNSIIQYQNVIIASFLEKCQYRIASFRLSEISARDVFRASHLHLCSLSYFFGERQCKTFPLKRFGNRLFCRRPQVISKIQQAMFPPYQIGTWPNPLSKDRIIQCTYAERVVNKLATHFRFYDIKSCIVEIFVSFLLPMPSKIGRCFLISWH